MPVNAVTYARICRAAVCCEAVNALAAEFETVRESAISGLVLNVYRTTLRVGVSQLRLAISPEMSASIHTAFDMSGVERSLPLKRAIEGNPLHFSSQPHARSHQTARPYREYASEPNPYSLSNPRPAGRTMPGC